jgi:hypothetical protein
MGKMHWHRNPCVGSSPARTYLKNSDAFKGIDFDDPAQEQTVYDTAIATKGTAEWFAFVAANLAMTVKEAISNNNAADAALGDGCV